MGNTTSKKTSVIPKTPEKSVAATIDQSPTSDESNQMNLMFDPKTPAIPQTPLTQTIASHLNRISKDDVNQNQAIKTPSYLLRKKILYDLGYTYSIKDVDPRSPSISIPRTPLKLAESDSNIVSESESSSFQYNTTLDESCRDFNTKLDEMTMDESEAAEISENVKHEENKKESVEPQKELCEQKTPDSNSNVTPNFVNHKHSDASAITVVDGKCADHGPKASEENISPLEGMYSTPQDKSNRTGRIPLSVINRRGLSAETTPLCAKNHHEPYSVEKCPNNLSLSKFDENRSSARKSKIPVYRKWFAESQL